MSHYPYVGSNKVWSNTTTSTSDLCTSALSVTKVLLLANFPNELTE